MTVRPSRPTPVETSNRRKVAHSLLVIGDDAADKVGVGIPECCHQLGKLFFVQLDNSPEHSLSDFGAKRTLHIQGTHADHIVCKKPSQSTRSDNNIDYIPQLFPVLNYVCCHDFYF